MVTNRQLREMPDHEAHKAIYAALAGAKMDDLIPCRWSCEGHEGCDTAWMLRTVCLHQTGERPVPLVMAVGLLTSGHAPRGATPWPDAAEALLARRGVEVEV